MVMYVYDIHTVTYIGVYVSVCKTPHMCTDNNARSGMHGDVHTHIIDMHTTCCLKLYASALLNVAQEDARLGRLDVTVCVAVQC